MKFFFTIWMLMPIMLAAQLSSRDSGELSFEDKPDYIRPAPIMTFLLMQGMITGMSYYAAKPSAYGDKVVGGLFVAGSAFMLYQAGLYWIDSKLVDDWDYKGERVVNTVLMLGVSYGFSRVTRYNLMDAKNDGFHKRFQRNLIEMNAAWLAPLTLTALADGICRKIEAGRKSRAKAKTSFIFGQNSMGLVMRF